MDNRRERLEQEISNLQNRINNAPKDLPVYITELWEKELVSLEFELNNLSDGEYDNN